MEKDLIEFTKAQANFSQEFKDKYAYSKIDDCVVAETQAEVTYLLHKVILARLLANTVVLQKLCVLF